MYRKWYVVTAVSEQFADITVITSNLLILYYYYGPCHNCRHA